MSKFAADCTAGIYVVSSTDGEPYLVECYMNLSQGRQEFVQFGVERTTLPRKILSGPWTMQQIMSGLA